MSRIPVIICLSALLLVFGSDQAYAYEVSENETVRYELAEYHMGTKVRIVCFCDDPLQAKRVTNLAFTRIHELEQICSDYQADSEVRRFCAQSPADKPIVLSNDLFEVLDHAQQLSSKTNGAFDVTIGPLSKVWRRIRRNLKMDQALLDQSKSLVGNQHLKLFPESSSAMLEKKNMRIDLGGIAKGYAADEALAVMENNGIHCAMIDAGGDISLGDPPPGKSGWSIAISKLDGKEIASETVQLQNCAVATSGDAFQHVVIDGKKYSHIIDPRTGNGLTRSSTVSVIAKSCIQADAWASALSVLGPADGFKLIQDNPMLASRIVVAENEQVKEYISDNWKPLIKSNSANLDCE